MNYIISNIVNMYMTDDEFYEVTYVDYNNGIVLIKNKIEGTLIKVKLEEI